MPFRRRLLSESQSAPPLDVLRGGHPMKRSRASSIHATGDRVLRHGRRILLHAGLHGAQEWRISNAEPGSGGGSQIYPMKGDEQVVMRVPAVPLTPGHFVRVGLIAIGSGAREKVSGIGYVGDGAGGKVRVTATYSNTGGPVDVAHTIKLPGSAEQYHAEPTEAEGAWTHLRRVRSPLLLPADMADTSELAAWTDGVTVELELVFIESPRVVDLIVWEEPLAVARDLAAGDWVMPLHAGVGGGNLGQLAGGVPLIRRTSTDPGGGAEIIADAARHLCQEIGPVLLSYTTWSESDQGLIEEARAQTVTSLTWIELLSSEVEYSDLDQGWSASSGAGARRVQESEEHVVMRDVDNVVPVQCWIYAAMDSPGVSASVRFATEAYSVAEVLVDSDTWAWYSVKGTLRCGLGAQDPIVLQVFGRANHIGAELSWRYLVVAFDPLS